MPNSNDAGLVGPDNPQEDAKEKKPVGRAGRKEQAGQAKVMVAAAVGPDNPQEDVAV